MAALTIYTIGHSNRSIDAFLTLLAAQQIEILADVRTIPASRHNPQFGRDELSRSLEGSGVEYVHEPRLGGHRRPRKDSPNAGWRNASFRGYADYMASDAFKAGLDALLSIAARGRTAIMCAEAVPWRCHRSLVADALIARGCTVLDIISDRAPTPHKATPFLKVQNGELLYPPEQPVLDDLTSG
jgi:uncharacterized protein (DUF488 family)